MASHFFHVLGDFGEGGDGRLAVGIALALGRRGVDSTCVALKAGGAACLAGVDVHSVELGANRGVLALTLGLVKLRRLVARSAPAVIHVHGPNSLMFVVQALLGLRPKPRLWFTWHDSGSVLGGSGLRRQAIIRCLYACDRVFGSSRDVCARLRLALPRRDVAVFRNGVAELPRTSGADLPGILWLGRFVPPKDPEIVLRAAGTLRREGHEFRVVMAGDAPAHLRWLYDRTVALSREQGLEGWIEFPGWVADPSPYYAQAEIGLQSSHTEGLSMALLEQMMAGLAVVATDVGDTNTAIEDEVTGLLIPPKDERALTDALRRVVTDGALRTKLGRRARERALSEFSFDAISSRVLALRDGTT